MDDPLASTSAAIPTMHTDYSHGHDHRGHHNGSELLPPSDGSSSIDSSSEKEPSLLACAIAGGLGGVVGDTLMHSLDTVKTRQQGASHVPKYNSTFTAYKSIFMEEGIRRGLYSGYSAALLGSLPSSAVFFLTYETVKRAAINDYNVPETIAFLGAGFIGDLASSFFYVPTEVMKARLQLQGRFNNPHFKSGYNYKGLIDAARTIVQKEGTSTLFYGYRATLTRDLPFSAFQLTFYEKFRQLAFTLTNKKLKNGENDDDDDELPLYAELMTGACAGGLAGVLTTPLDVIKTRMQTQNEASGAPLLKSNSIISSLKTIYQSQGFKGLFGGVGPRLIWTSVQSSIMLLLYQMTLRALEDRV